MNQPIFTLGHSTHAIDTFVSLLRRHAVDTVVDVLVPLDAPCPAGTETHRDRQGIVTVCLRDE